MSYPSNEPDDDELTDPALRRLILEVARDRFRPFLDAAAADYMTAYRRREKAISAIRIHNQKLENNEGRKLVPNSLAPFDPKALDGIWRGLLDHAEVHVLEALQRDVSNRFARTINRKQA